MPTNIKVIRTRDFIKVTPYGHFDLEASQKLLAEVVATASTVKDHEVILDTRGVEADLNSQDLWSLAATIGASRKVFTGRTAVLCPVDRFDRAKFFALCADHQGLNVRAFVSYEDAMEWLISDNVTGNP
jgi:hypothetical protein